MLGNGSTNTINSVEEEDCYAVDNRAYIECCISYKGENWKYANFDILDNSSVQRNNADVEIIRKDCYYDSEGAIVADFVLLYQDEMLRECIDYEIKSVEYNHIYHEFDVVIEGKGIHVNTLEFGVSDNNDIYFVTEDGKWRVLIPSDGNSPILTAYLGNEADVVVPDIVSVSENVDYSETEVKVRLSDFGGVFANCSDMFTLHLGSGNGLSEYMVINCPNIRTV